MGIFKRLTINGSFTDATLTDPIISDATFDSSIKINRTTTAISYAVLATDFYIGVTSTAAPRTITLEAAAEAGAGRMLIIKDESGGAATNNITIDAATTELIDGSQTFTMSNNFQSITLICTGTAWFIV